ncbi:MAG: ABC transporter ATP-binding protein [Chloroflexi bacterium]|nr:ABC transporter ATP-binding protein [Chloroflexota bacterium]
MTEPLIQIRDLRTYLYTRRGVVKAVDGISFDIHEGEIVGLVGESGSGKTMTSLSILQLVPQPAGRIVGGSIMFEGEDLLTLPESRLQEIRGERISMILQDPLTALNPVYSIGNQVAEPFQFHPKEDGRGATIRNRVVEVLQRVGIPAAETRVKDFPHQFSGGMRQRVCAAIAIAPRPRLLIADEPTTALDVTIQAQFLRLLKQLQQEFNLAVLYITHDLGVVARLCNRVVVMYAGKIVETGDVTRIYKQPAHPYTQGLMQSVPRLGMKRERLFQIQGQPPDFLDLPQGCPFWPRCPQAQDVCKVEEPPVAAVGTAGTVRCWFPDLTGATQPVSSAV